MENLIFSDQRHLKHHYTTKSSRETLNGNLRFLIQNLLNLLLCLTDIKESCLFMAENVETLDLNN